MRSSSTAMPPRSAPGCSATRVARGRAGDRAATQRSLSAITWHAVGAHARASRCSGTTCSSAPTTAREFDELFATRRLPRDPTVYVCAQDRGDDDASDADGPERADAASSTRRPTRRCRVRSTPRRSRDATATMIERAGGAAACVSSRRRRARVTTTPSDFARLFPATRRRALRPATHGWAASFERPGARSRDPGPVPGGRQRASGPGRADGGAVGPAWRRASLIADRADGPRFDRRGSAATATRGGMSTR